MGIIQGDLSLMPLVDIAAWIANRGASGQLRVRRRQSEELFDVERGNVVRATSKNPRNYFGQFFLHFGLLTEEELERAYITQTETQVRLGRILVMIGLVPEEQVMQMLRLKITENLLDPFRWQEGEFVFDDQRRSPLGPEVEVAIPLGDICTEGLARAELWRQYEGLVPNPEMVLWVVEDVAKRVPRESMKGRILALGRRRLSVESIGLELHASEFQLARHLIELHQLGAVRAEEPTEGLPVPGDLDQEPEGTADLVRMAEVALGSARYGDAQRWVDEGLARAPEDERLRGVAARLREITGSGPDGVQDKRPVMIGEAPAHLSAKERYVLARVDGNRSVRSIMQVSPMRDAEAMEVILRFVERGVIRLED